MTEQKIVEIFKERNFRATPQRIAVYKYLREHPTHPDVDEIYKAVLADNPAFSRTTVYNSLQALEKEGLIQSVKIDSGKITTAITNCMVTFCVRNAKEFLILRLTTRFAKA